MPSAGRVPRRPALAGCPVEAWLPLPPSAYTLWPCLQALCDRLRREMSVLICRVPVGPPGAPPVTEAAWQELVLWPAEQAPGRDPYLHVSRRCPGGGCVSGSGGRG